MEMAEQGEDELILSVLSPRLQTDQGKLLLSPFKKKHGSHKKRMLAYDGTLLRKNVTHGVFRQQVDLEIDPIQSIINSHSEYLTKSLPKLPAIDDDTIANEIKSSGLIRKGEGYIWYEFGEQDVDVEEIEKKLAAITEKVKQQCSVPKRELIQMKDCTIHEVNANECTVTVTPPPASDSHSQIANVEISAVNENDDRPPEI